MAKWLNPLSRTEKERLQSLYHDLKDEKPTGWSVVVREENELSIRPEDRSVGKFSLTVHDDRINVSFFSQELNLWNKHKDFEYETDMVGDILKWMNKELEDPKDETREKEAL
jgi:hypothetical protein